MCLGRNEECRKTVVDQHKSLTFLECFTCIQMENLPASLRVVYVDLLIDLFVDVGANRCVVCCSACFACFCCCLCVVHVVGMFLSLRPSAMHTTLSLLSLTRMLLRTSACHVLLQLLHADVYVQDEEPVWQRDARV